VTVGPVAFYSYGGGVGSCNPTFDDLRKLKYQQSRSLLGHESVDGVELQDLTLGVHWAYSSNGPEIVAGREPRAVTAWVDKAKFRADGQCLAVSMV
jgi:hypothetical protein